MSEYVTHRKTVHGVTVDQHLHVLPWDDLRTEETLRVWVGSLPETATEVAIWFGQFPDDAHVRDDDENPGSFDITWERPTTDEELARHRAAAEAARLEAERAAEFDRWCAERYPKPLSS